VFSQSDYKARLIVSRVELSCLRDTSVVTIPFDDSSSYSSPDHEMISPLESPTFIGPGELPLESRYSQACCEEFVMSLENFQRLAHSRRSETSPSDNYDINKSVCAATLQPGTPLHRLLSKPYEERAGFKSSRWVQDLCHFAALVYLHLTIWEFRDDLHAMDQYFKRLRFHLIDNGLVWSGSNEALVWVLLTGGDNEHLDTPPRTRQVLRMMQVARKFGPETWAKVKHILTETLFLRDANDKLELDLGWDPWQIRHEVFGTSTMFSDNQDQGSR
jgi:hypothetical protein